MDAATRAMIFNAADEEAVKAGCWFDQSAADRVIAFFAKFLRHSKGQFAGKAFEPLEWQSKDIIYPVYGWKRPDGTRRFRRAYIEIPKKNGKSTLCSGFTIYALVADGEAGAEVYSAANDRDQAAIVYNEAANMVEASPALAERIQLIRSQKRMEFPLTRSIYKALSADVPTKEGLNISTLIFDELHALKGRELWDTLRYGGAARRQPLTIVITTAGHDRTSVCWDQHRYALGIQESVNLDWTYFAYVKGASPEDDWRDERVWEKANPSWGVTINKDEMGESAKEAAMSGAQLNSFKRYRLNIWTEQADRWLDVEAWDACAGDLPSEEELKDEECWAGLDMSSTTDLCAFAAWYPALACVEFKFWMPEDADRKRERLSKQLMGHWADAGWIERTSGDVVDYDLVRDWIVRWAERRTLRTLAIDRWNTTQMQTQLMTEGIEVFKYGQGFASMTAPCKELEKLLAAKAFRHGGHPVARWMARNVAAKMDPAGNLKPDKAKSGDKIDGIVAFLMSLGIAALGEGDGPSVYDKRGLRRI